MFFIYFLGSFDSLIKYGIFRCWLETKDWNGIWFYGRVPFANKKEDGSVSQEEGEEEQICSLLSLSLSRVVLF